MPIDNRDNLANRVLGNTGKLIIWIFFQDVTNYNIITRKRENPFAPLASYGLCKANV